MERINNFIRTSLIGGFLVILPLAILVLVFQWMFSFITNLIQPITNLILKEVQTKEFIADYIVVVLIVLLCFFVGVFVKTRIGRFVHFTFENKFLKTIPGYNLVKETVLHFLGGKKSPFSSVALVRVYGNDTLMTAFVTDETDDYITVFVPSGPNPTTGYIFHLAHKDVYKINIGVEDAMRSIIGCGASSSKLIENYLLNLKK